MGGIIDLDSAAKVLVSGLGPIVDRAISQATTQLVPAIGEEFKSGVQAAVKTAVDGLSTDSQQAIAALGDRIDKLIPEAEAAGERLIAKFFSEFRSVFGSLGGGK